MKILYTNFHQQDGGGHTTYIMNLARALSGKHQIIVAAPGNSRLFQAARAIPGVETIALSFSNRIPTLLRSSRVLRQLIDSRHVDVVHVNGSSDHRTALLATLGMGKKRPRIVYTKHNDLPATGTATWLKARFATDRVICVCKYTKLALTTTAYSKRGLDVVYNGIDAQHYAVPNAATIAAARRQWLPVGEQDVLLLGSNAGTADYKGWFDLLEAVSYLPASMQAQLRILLAGELPCPAQLARIAALGLTDRITFTGMLEDVRPFIAALDIGFVLSHQETISFACREMMAMGKPVLVSSAGGLPENITQGLDGWVVPASNPGAIAVWLRNVLADRNRITTIGNAAHIKAARDFSLAMFVNGTERVYQEVLRSR